MIENLHLPVERSACAKVILCGEHAVVYGRPAIALPLSHLRARARLEPSDQPFRIIAADLNRAYTAADDADYSLMRLAAAALNFARAASGLSLSDVRAQLTLTSDIPAAAHLGSSAAVSVAVARAVAAWAGRELTPAEASALAFEAEKMHHGTPSGIDNTVVAWEQPVWFVRASGEPASGAAQIEPIAIPALPHLVIADTGLSTPTRIPVGDVRRGWESNPAVYEQLFDRIAGVVSASRQALVAGDWERLGRLMDDNHALLCDLGVSCAELDALCEAARKAGALGAKLSGGGRGGNMIALARDAQHAALLREQLLAAGAKRVM